MRVTSALTILATAPLALAMLPSGEGRCAKNPYKPEDESLKCIWGQLAAILDCAGETSCSEEGAPCYADQSCEGCAWYVHCT
ncbi:uncharacterized protein J7T54_003109 [Emericellopsis cladophorae]|uniref:Uncharacterized protein n=1 Tax=Emericellopsis cladophorae TaxID=2686198 RepID=A0A9Q0BD30_9HYPO|nr:uncharacterized protein J7T54_003109 [Emericellopsis cladophorae]KAI6780967.1 hypothetical protein J7T54_003109 [Emericellopsis cladophorae]